MKPDPDAQEQFEALLKDDSGIVVPPSPGGSEQHKLHVLTALLRKYKALVRPPVTAKHDATGYEAKVQRVMRLTEDIRPERPPRSDFLAELTAFLSFDWMRPAVLVSVAASALLVAALMISIVVERAGQSRNSLLVLNCIPANVVAQQFVLRGGTATQIKSLEITAAVMNTLTNTSALSSIVSQYSEAQEYPGGPASAYPEALLQGTKQHFVIVVARVPKAEGGQLELRLYDTKKKTLVLATKIEASDPDELRETVANIARTFSGEIFPAR